jgi:hypothetical protein
VKDIIIIIIIIHRNRVHIMFSHVGSSSAPTWGMNFYIEPCGKIWDHGK